MYPQSLRAQAVALRKSGKTYSQIRQSLSVNVPKGTLSYWLHDIHISPMGQKRRKKIIDTQLRSARKKALQKKRDMREDYFRALKEHNMHLLHTMRDKGVLMLLLSTLYIAEGTKAGVRHASVTLGNSDPRIIRMFLSLLRQCYDLDEKKFRCTVQCRADMDTKELGKFWSRVTKVPLSQFYAPRIDPRTVGKATKKPNYKGVCRVQYFSATIFHELMMIFTILSESIV